MKKLLNFFLITALLLFFLTGCRTKAQEQAVAPFSDATWNKTPEELIGLEENDFTTTPSVYGGDSYLFPVTWLDHEGTVKYMYDQNKNLVSIAFYYETQSREDMEILYDTIRKQALEKYGESIPTTNQDNLGDRWIRSEGNIILAAFWTKESCALQYSFLHPSISRDAEGNLSTQ
ncbi:MAG: hypothetical protein ACI4DQ_11450 [Lachnospiraceae bacterium]